MKNNNLQESKPFYIHESSHSVDNEIDLIDLATVFIRRKKMIASISIFITTLGVILALLSPKSYSFTTSIEVGSQIINGTINPLESSQTLLAKIQYVFIQQTLNEQRLTLINQGDKKRHKIKARIPKNSEIIVLEIIGTEEEASLMVALLQKVTQLAVQDHQRIYDAVKKNLLALEKKSQVALTSLNFKSNDDFVEKRRFLQGNIDIQKSQLANLRSTREILPPMKSLESINTSKTLVVTIITFVGILLAIFSAFLAEFIVRVKERQNLAISS